MIWPVQQMDHGTQIRLILLIGLLREAISIDLAAGTAIQVGDLEDEVERFEKYVDQCDDAKLLDLSIDHFNVLTAISGNGLPAWNERLIGRGICLEEGCGQESEIEYQAALYSGVVPSLTNDIMCRFGVVDYCCHLA